MNKITRVDKVMSAVYDLAVSPPTYEITTFLAEAEKCRLALGFEAIDVVFQPGPKAGFRDDNLPPDNIERESMLWRVCVPCTKLLPSLRNVLILRERAQITAYFPENYDSSSPKSHYGLKYFKNGLRCLRATESAVRENKRLMQNIPYVTITMREAEYWPTRNSDRQAWGEVAEYLKKIGYRPIFIPDTHGRPIEGYDNSLIASWDVDLRMALYQGATLNLGASNGPMTLCMVGGLPYIIFKVVTGDNSPATKLGFLQLHGIQHGDDITETGKTIWEDDTAEVIIREIKAWFESHKGLAGEK